MSTESNAAGSLDEETSLDQTNEQPPYLGNIAFWVSDFARMRRFYSEIIGVPEIASGERPRNWVFYVYGPFAFSLNQGEFAPEEKGWARCPKNPSLGESWEPYISFYVPDLAAVIDRCRAEGLPIHSGEPFSLGEGFGISIEVKDPDGNTVAITER